MNQWRQQNTMAASSGSDLRSSYDHLLLSLPLNTHSSRHDDWPRTYSLQDGCPVLSNLVLKPVAIRLTNVCSDLPLLLGPCRYWNCDWSPRCPDWRTERSVGSFVPPLADTTMGFKACHGNLGYTSGISGRSGDNLLQNFETVSGMNDQMLHNLETAHGMNLLFKEFLNAQMQLLHDCPRDSEVSKRMFSYETYSPLINSNKTVTPHSNMNTSFHEQTILKSKTDKDIVRQNDSNMAVIPSMTKQNDLHVAKSKPEKNKFKAKSYSIQKTKHALNKINKSKKQEMIIEAPAANRDTIKKEIKKIKIDKRMDRTNIEYLVKNQQVIDKCHDLWEKNVSVSLIPRKEKSFERTKPIACQLSNHDNSETLAKRQSLDRKAFSCHQCHYVTDRKNNLKRHVITMHQESAKTLECCGLVFQSKASLREHNSVFHRGGYQCQICSRNFCRKALLRRHLTVHSGQKDYFCGQCGYATSHKSNLERHQKVHTKKIASNEKFRKDLTHKKRSPPCLDDLSKSQRLSKIKSEKKVHIENKVPTLNILHKVLAPPTTEECIGNFESANVTDNKKSFETIPTLQTSSLLAGHCEWFVDGPLPKS